MLRVLAGTASPSAHHVHGLDLRRCECVGTFYLVAEIHDADVIARVLDPMNLPTEPLPMSPARPPPSDDDWDWAA